MYWLQTPDAPLYEDADIMFVGASPIITNSAERNALVLRLTPTDTTFLIDNVRKLWVSSGTVHTFGKSGAKSMPGVTMLVNEVRILVSTYCPGPQDPLLALDRTISTQDGIHMFNSTSCIISPTPTNF